jgi:hypothetical protein
MGALFDQAARLGAGVLGERGHYESKIQQREYNYGAEKFMEHDVITSIQSHRPL